MSEQPHAALLLPRLQTNQVARPQDPQPMFSDATRTPSQRQGPQTPRTTPDHLVYALPLPALFHRNGRIAAINQDLLSLIQHPEPRFLIGLPCDALLGHAAEPNQETGGTPVILQTKNGPVSVELYATNVVLADCQGTVWTFAVQQPPEAARTPQQRLMDHASDALHETVSALEDLYGEIWEDDEELTVDFVSETVLRALDRANTSLHTLRAALAEDPCRAELEAGIAAAIRETRRRVPTATLQVEVRELPVVRASADALRETLTTVLVCASVASRVRTSVHAWTDAAGHAIVDLRLEGGTFSREDVRVCRPLVQRVNGSLLQMAPNHVRLRISPARDAAVVVDS